jgi:hypothetical protein
MRTAFRCAAAAFVSMTMVGGCSLEALRWPLDQVPPRRAAVVAQWALISIAGDPLPAVGSQSAGSTTLVLGDTLVLLADSMVQQVGMERVRGGEPVQHVDFRIVREYRAQFRGDTVALFLKCPREALCSPGPSLLGELRGEQLSLRPAASGRRTPLDYRKLPNGASSP